MDADEISRIETDHDLPGVSEGCDDEPPQIRAAVFLFQGQEFDAAPWRILMVMPLFAGIHHETGLCRAVGAYHRRAEGLFYGRELDQGGKLVGEGDDVGNVELSSRIEGPEGELREERRVRFQHFRTVGVKLVRHA